MKASLPIAGFALAASLAACSRDAHHEVAAATNSTERVAALNAVDLDGRTIDPFASAAGAKAIVFVFVSNECPIANRYAPEVQRIHARFSDRGVRMWLVHPDPSETPESIRTHSKEFGYAIPVLRDVRQTLARLSKTRVTPEAAVFLPGGELVYHGRIDDRFADFGKERPAPARRDLVDVLERVLAGNVAPVPSQTAVGCQLPRL